MFIMTEMVEGSRRMMTLGLWIENVSSNRKGSSTSVGYTKVLKRHCNFERSQWQNRILSLPTPTDTPKLQLHIEQLFLRTKSRTALPQRNIFININK